MSLFQLRSAEEETTLAKREAQIAHDKASMTRNLTEANKAMLQDLLDQISEFLSADGATPADIRTVRPPIAFDLEETVT